MDADPQFRKHQQSLKRLLGRVEKALGETATALDAIASEAPAATMRQQDRLQSQLAQSLTDYLHESGAFMEYLREHERRIEEARRSAAMSEKRTKQPRDDARIQELSEALTSDMRLQRVDSAIKELLDFLSDADFFAANASTGRRRRLRSLQNAIEKALEK
ncbi:MAG TPA: hypothetical protein VFX19_03570 [Dehalococcoidia bacterium]|nr:hypothetical protein [Dehalococcoidia bacterium]